MENSVKTKQKGEDTKRLAEIVSVFNKYGFAIKPTPEKAKSILSELGPTFVKIGQLLSLRPEFIPEEYCEVLSTLRNDVPPMEKSLVVEIIETECGKKIEEVFSEFEYEPIGSASIAQVHRAVLLDGTPVAVKVQRANIYEVMERDFSLLRRLGKFFAVTPFGKLVDLDMVVDEIWASAQKEMDFRIEADNFEEYAANNVNIKYVACPAIYREYLTKNLLVMDFSDGVQIDNVEVLKEKGYDVEEISRKLIDNYLKQIIEDRFFQADPHPGNIFVADGKLIWLDMGMMGRITEKESKNYEKALYAVFTHDAVSLKESVLSLGTCTKPIDDIKLEEDIEDYLNCYGYTARADINMKAFINDAMALTNRHGIRLPDSAVMICRGVATLDGILEKNSPDVNVVGVLMAGISDHLIRSIDFNKEAVNFLSDLALYVRNTVKMPAKMYEAVEKLNSGRIKFRLEQSTLDKIIKSREKGNRKIVCGILAAGLVIGGCITICQPTVVGLAVGIVCFAVGIALGVLALLK